VLAPGAINRSATSPHHRQPSSHSFLFANDEHEPQLEIRVEQMPCVTLSVLDLVLVAGVCECILGLFQKGRKDSGEGTSETHLLGSCRGLNGGGDED
jgi:hypothetical protein